MHDLAGLPTCMDALVRPVLERYVRLIDALPDGPTEALLTLRQAYITALSAAPALRSTESYASPPPL